MKHHKLVTRTPLMAQTKYEPHQTAYESKMNYMATLVAQIIHFSFNKSIKL